jgi:Polymer-forming cytoskeletal
MVQFPAGLPSFECHIRHPRRPASAIFTAENQPEARQSGQASSACRGGRSRQDRDNVDLRPRHGICEGAKVEGKVMAQDAVINSHYKGAVHGITVKLQSSAVVDGEIFNRSLTIEQTHSSKASRAVSVSRWKRPRSTACMPKSGTAATRRSSTR